MKHRIFTLLLLTALLPPRAPAGAATDSEQGAAARTILDAWHLENPRPGDRKTHVVYWTPADREPAPEYHERITRMLKHIQQFYADEMERLGFGPRTFQLPLAEDGELIIHMAKGKEPAANYTKQSAKVIRKDWLPIVKAASIDPNRETMLIFTNLGFWDPDKNTIRHQSPYHGGGSHRAGSAWQLDSPILDTLRLKDTEPMVRDGEYGRISMGKHNSIFIGGIAHEFGHGLGLPHNKERPGDKETLGTALMGSGNRTYGDELRGDSKGSFLTLASALRLAAHPQFSGSVKQMNAPHRAEFTDLAIEPGEKSFTLSGRVEANPPVHGIIAFLDPEGGSNYDATTATAIPDADGRFTLDCTALRPGKPAALGLTACHVNGGVTKRNFGYSVAKDGAPDVTGMQRAFALTPLIAALQENGNQAAVDNAFDYLNEHAPDKAGGLTHRIGKRLVAARAGRKPSTLPASLPDETTTIPLSEAQPSHAEVGWMKPHYDIAPDPGLVLSCGGRLFEHGIYAHAPAKHAYDLGGKWKSLTGACGLADSHPGSVVFVINVDGKEAWRSQTAESGKTQTYEIDLTGAKSLELLVEDAGDGAGGDWGMWFAPILTR